LGILGLGAIGQELARLAAVLRMEVVGTRRNPAPLPGVAEVLPPERTDEVLARADFLVLLLPATAETDNFINAARLAKMKPTAWLLNFGRGSAIVDADLIAAAEAGTIAGALLDVFREEPVPAGHPFWTARNIKVVPHMGGLHTARDKAVAKLFVENLGRFLEGRPLLSVVDRVAGY
jgi:phosphoglycerate dehydrogenase-like enzyme